MPRVRVSIHDTHDQEHGEVHVHVHVPWCTICGKVRGKRGRGVRSCEDGVRVGTFVKKIEETGEARGVIEGVKGEG